MSKIKVLHLELDGHLGGIESFLCNLYSQIDKEKVQFDFVSRSSHPAKSEELTSFGAKIYKVSSFKNPIKYMRDIDRVIKRGYDVIHIHKNSAAVILPFLIARRYKSLKIFAHSHNTMPSAGKFTILLHKVNKGLMWKLSDEHYACSKIAGDWLYGEKKNFIVLNNGIVAKKYLFDKNIRKHYRENLRLDDDDFVFGHVGRFAVQKNHKRLIDIFEVALTKYPKSKLLLVGDGALKEEIRNYVQGKKLQDNIEFLGVRDDIPELMMAMDAFIMPSLYEGLPIVAVEAQCSGLKLYLSDTISKDTEITNSIRWFDLDESNEEIVKKFEYSFVSEEQRKVNNCNVIKAGYDIATTAEYLCNRYQLSRRTKN